MIRRLLAPLVLLLAAPAAFAQEGPRDPRDPSRPEDQVQELARKISRALKDNEEALTRLSRGERADPKGVDISLPANRSEEHTGSGTWKSPNSAGGGGGNGGEGGDCPACSAEAKRASDLLEKSGTHSREVIEAIEEILRLAAQSSSSSGQKGSSHMPDDGKDDPSSGKDPNRKKGPEEKKDPLKDNDPSKKDPGQGDPKDGRKNSEKPREKAQPPKSPLLPPDPKDPRSVFFARLPDKVKEAVLDGDFDRVPERYRDLVREWTESLSKKDVEEAAGRTGEGR